MNCYSIYGRKDKKKISVVSNRIVQMELEAVFDYMTISSRVKSSKKNIVLRYLWS